MSEWSKRRKAQIQQRLFGVGVACGATAFWFWLMSYGTEYIWFGLVAIPFIVAGLWHALTDEEVFWEMEEEDNDRT